MKNKFLAFILIAALSPLIVSVSKEGALVEYPYKNGRLCFNSKDVLENTKQENSTDGRRYLLVKLKNFKSRINKKSRYNPDYPFSTHANVNDLNESKSRYLKLTESIKKNIANVVPTFNTDLNLYEYSIPDETNAVGVTYYLKAEISNLGEKAEPYNLSDWYLGLCTDGYGGEPKCSLTYVYDKEIVLEYKVVISALRKWKEIEAQISSKLDSSRCK